MVRGLLPAWSLLAYSLPAWLLLLSPLPGLAQMIPPYIGITTRPWEPSGSCANAPPACMGAGWDLDLGPHEFDIYRANVYSMIDRVRMSLAWPGGWTLTGWELCNGVLVSGDPGVEHSPLEFSFPDCAYTEQPFLRMWFDCPVPGTFGVSGEPLVWECGSPYESTEIYGPHCDIGDFCGMRHERPCDACGGVSLAGHFSPSRVDLALPQGGAFEDTLMVSGSLGPQCPGIPECGEGYGACFGSLESDSPWILVDLLDGEGEGYQEMRYRILVRARNLPPGVHEGRVYARPSCGECVSMCAPVTLTVTEPAAADGAGPPPSSRILSVPTPNPVTNVTVCSIRLAEAAAVRLQVVNAGGRVVATLLDRLLPSGDHPVTWRAVDGGGRAVPSGVYFLRLSAAGVRDGRTLVVRR